MSQSEKGFLTTHVLDTMSGEPAAGMALDLFRIEGDGRQHLTSRVTNSDGRCDSPIIDAESFETGTYELVFAVGDYFARSGANLPDPPFLDIVPIRFGIADPASHYHVPLLVSPYSFSTYRGS